MPGKKIHDQTTIYLNSSFLITAFLFLNDAYDLFNNCLCDLNNRKDKDEQEDEITKDFFKGHDVDPSFLKICTYFDFIELSL